MKIFIDGIIYSLQKTGGISRYFNELLPRLIEINPAIQIELLIHQSRIGLIPKQRNIHLKEFSQSGLLSKIIINQYLKRQTQGVFHSSYYTTYHNLNIPQVITVYDMIYEKYPHFFNIKKDFRFIEQKKTTINKANRIIAISEAVKKDILYFYPTVKNKLKVIHLGVNNAFYQFKNKKEISIFLRKKYISKKYFLYVGHRKKYKNFINFIKVFTKLEDKNIFLVLIGGGELTREENILIKKLNLSKRIIHLLNITDRELIIIYNASLGLVIPSFDEGFGIPALEAMACGTPVILSNIPVFKEIAGNVGYYFNPLEAKSMFNCLNSFLKLKQKEKLKKINLGFKIAKEFTWQKTAQKTLAVYKELLKNK